MSIERLYSILLEEKPSYSLLCNEKELFKLIPELDICKGFNQNNEWHIYDVYEHILHVVDNVPNDLVLRLAALFHDIGKPISYKEDENGVGHFYGHWETSQKIFDSFASKYGLDKAISDLVSNLIYYHDINITKLDSYDEIYGVFDIEGIKMLYQLKKADLLAQNPKYHYILNEYNNQEQKLLLKYRSGGFNG